MLNVRRATSADEDTVASLRSEALTSVAEERDGERFIAVEHATGESESALRDAIGTHESTTDGGMAIAVLGCIGEAVCAYGLMTCLGERATLREIFTAPDCRGVGLGHAVLTELQQIALAAGCDFMDSHALPGDRATKNFFEAHAMKARLITTSGDLVAHKGSSGPVA